MKRLLSILAASTAALLPASILAIGINVWMLKGVQPGFTSLLIGALVVAVLTLPAVVLFGSAIWGSERVLAHLKLQDEPVRAASLLYGALIGLGTVAILYLVLFAGYYAGFNEEVLKKPAIASKMLGIGSIVLLLVGATIGLFVAALSMDRLSRLTERRAQILLRVFRPGVLLAMVLVLAGGVYLQASRDNLYQVAQAPLAIFAWLVGMFLVLPLCLRIVTTPRRIALTFLSAAVLVSIVFGGWLFSARVQADLRQVAIANRLISKWQALFDSDGDGYSRLFNHGDCNDNDPNTNPLAADFGMGLANGVDNNCNGHIDEETYDVIGPVWSRVDGLLANHGPQLRNQLPEPIPETDPSDLSCAETCQAQCAATEAAAQVRPKNIILILVDTLRGDHIHSLGYEREISPNMDKLVEGGTAFRYAHAPSNRTPWSIPSILTGRYPSEIPWRGRRSNYRKLRDEAWMMAEAMAEQGLDTVAITSHHYFVKKRNIRQGFRIWANGIGDRQTIKASNYDMSAPRITRRSKKMLKKLASAEKPFFLFVHYSDPHGSYMGHRGFKRFGKGRLDRYDGEILFTDHHLGELLASLEPLGLSENTGIVILSDHGEAFKEHGKYWHGHNIHQEEIHVPLIVSGPGVKAQIIEDPVGLVDVFPTLLDWIGAAEALPDDMRERSLYPLLRGQSPTPRPVYAQLLPYPSWKQEQHALIHGTMKVMYHRTHNLWELYDLSTDPTEQKNLHGSHPESERLSKLLKQYIHRYRTTR